MKWDQCWWRCFPRSKHFENLFSNLWFEVGLCRGFCDIVKKQKFLTVRESEPTLIVLPFYFFQARSISHDLLAENFVSPWCSLMSTNRRWSVTTKISLVGRCFKSREFYRLFIKTHIKYTHTQAMQPNCYVLNVLTEKLLGDFEICVSPCSKRVQNVPASQIVHLLIWW